MVSLEKWYIFYFVVKKWVVKEKTNVAWPLTKSSFWSLKIIQMVPFVTCLPFALCVVFSLIICLMRRQWHPTPVLLPGKSHGRRGLVGCSPWHRKESDTTERFHFTHFTLFILYHWRRKWEPTPVFLPGQPHGQSSLAGHGPWGHRVRHD